MLLSELQRELLTRQEFAGWAPHGKILGETNCKEPGDRHRDLWKTLAPKLAGCPWGAGATGMGDKLQEGRAGGTGNVQPQEDTSPPSPLGPSRLLNTLSQMALWLFQSIENRPARGQSESWAQFWRVTALMAAGQGCGMAPVCPPAPLQLLHGLAAPEGAGVMCPSWLPPLQEPELQQVPPCCRQRLPELKSQFQMRCHHLYQGIH